MPQQESLELATIDDTLACLIGIRYCVGVIADRTGGKLTAEDWAELNTILDLVNSIQTDHLKLRALVSMEYQRRM